MVVREEEGTVTGMSERSEGEAGLTHFVALH